jgi:hypothetical protein
MMNIAELIARLQTMPQDAEVHFEYGFGDYWRTTVAPKVSSVELGLVEWSEYHRMPKVVEPDWDNEDADEVESTTQVVLLG